jgi:hypothetical protein
MSKEAVPAPLVVGRTQADMVIFGVPEMGLPGPATHLLAKYPHLKILTVAPHVRRELL